MPFRFLEHITCADIAVEANAKSLGSLLAQSGKALTAVQVDARSMKTITTTKTRIFSVTGSDEEQLLVHFLNELLYYKDAERILFKKITVRVRKSNARNAKNVYRATCTGNGSTISQRMALGTDVKGITLHKLRVAKKRKTWIARFVLDV